MPRLKVYYDPIEIAGEAISRDEEIEEIAGVKITDSGTNTRNGVRDVDLEFPSRSALIAAKAELQAAGFRFVASYGGEEYG